MTIHSEARDIGLDFTRFLYIAMMVIYHCYESASFFSADGMININRYLGLVSGSFPFLAGFLVSYHYLQILQRGSYSVALRLLSRGMRLVGIYVLINVALTFWVRDMLSESLLPRSPHPWWSIFYAEPIYTAYDILVQIGVVVIIGGFIALVMTRMGKDSAKPIQVLVGLGILLALARDQPGLASGLTGIMSGFRTTDAFLMKLSRLRPVWWGAALYGLIFAIMYTKSHTALYVIGVLTLFYTARVGASMLPLHRPAVAREVGIFGKYSLLIYLFHVPVVVVLSRTMPTMLSAMPDTIRFLVLLIVVSVLSRIFVGIVDVLRKQYAVVNTTYRALLE